MFIGHFGAGFAAKRLAPRVSLGTLLLAAQFIDLLWPTFLLLGWERVRIEPGMTASNPLAFEYYPFSHSLLAVAGWAALLGGAAWLMRRDVRASLVIGALVVSHWLLDALVHIPDLPLAPGGAARIGAGLWNYPLIEITIELAVLAVGVLLYARTTVAHDRTGTWSLVSLVVVLLLIQAGNAVGDAPPSVTAIAWVGQAQWLLVAWGYWIDSHRALPSASEPRSFSPR